MTDPTPGRELPTFAYFSTYHRLFRVHVHQLIVWGYEDGRRRIGSADEEEPDITSFICEAIEDRLRDPRCPNWCRRYDVKENPPVRHKGRTGKAKLKPDVIIVGVAIRGMPEFVFEAKRLGTGSHGVSEYLGSEGMGCFIAGVYAARYGEAGMLGYVQRESIAYWRSELRSAIERRSASLCLRCPQRETSVIDALPGEWVSEHERGAVGRPLAVCHILLDCRPENAPPCSGATQAGPDQQ